MCEKTFISDRVREIKSAQKYVCEKIDMNKVFHILTFLDILLFSVPQPSTLKDVYIYLLVFSPKFTPSLG